MPKLSKQRIILPLFMFTMVLMLGVRIGDAWQIIRAPAVSEAKAETAPAKPATDSAPQPTANNGSRPQAKTDEPTSNPASAFQEELSANEMALLKQLAARRDTLDQRARELDQRDAVMKVAEQRVDQKLTEMKTLRAQLDKILNQASSDQKAQIESLVKIYETMKPKDAAKIFEALDLPVLLGVIQKMREQKAALILADMAPAKAKEITTALIKSRELTNSK